MSGYGYRWSKCARGGGSSGPGGLVAVAVVIGVAAAMAGFALEYLWQAIAVTAGAGALAVAAALLLMRWNERQAARVAVMLEQRRQTLPLQTRQDRPRWPTTGWAVRDRRPDDDALQHRILGPDR